jgi:hypothetical protein
VVGKYVPNGEIYCTYSVYASQCGGIYTIGLRTPYAVGTPYMISHNQPQIKPLIGHQACLVSDIVSVRLSHATVVPDFNLFHLMLNGLATQQSMCTS